MVRRKISTRSAGIARQNGRSSCRPSGRPASGGRPIENVRTPRHCPPPVRSWLACTFGGRSRSAAETPGETPGSSFAFPLRSCRSSIPPSPWPPGDGAGAGSYRTCSGSESRYRRGCTYRSRGPVRRRERSCCAGRWECVPCAEWSNYRRGHPSGGGPGDPYTAKYREPLPGR